MSLAAAASTGASETQMPGAFVGGTGTAATEGPAHTSLDRERQSGDGYLYSASSRVMNRTKIVFLVQSGDRAEREFDLGDTVIQVKQSLLANWPENFAIKPTDTSDLRILYRGHFLDDKDTLSGKFI
ncbi:hypothetical protein GGF37_003926 [Kickxella alabastrina]|nr:hypothetical protein GGF37_003926 [Kickxella alabastrina]